jgi:hypothetical protein
LETSWAPHIDHDLSQLLLLHGEMRTDQYSNYPESIRRAVKVAYAVHMRALLEFFHNGRSRDDCKPTDRRDFTIAEFLG